MSRVRGDLPLGRERSRSARPGAPNHPAWARKVTLTSTGRAQPPGMGAEGPALVSALTGDGGHLRPLEPSLGEAPTVGGAPQHAVVAAVAPLHLAVLQVVDDTLELGPGHVTVDVHPGIRDVVDDPGLERSQGRELGA